MKNPIESAGASSEGVFNSPKNLSPSSTPVDLDLLNSSSIENSRPKKSNWKRLSWEARKVSTKDNVSGAVMSGKNIRLRI